MNNSIENKYVQRPVGPPLPPGDLKYRDPTRKVNDYRQGLGNMTRTTGQNQNNVGKNQRIRLKDVPI